MKLFTLTLTTALLASTAAFACDQHRWEYEGARGPAAWGKLHPKFAACAEGKEQSPFDIRSVKSEIMPPLFLDYQSQDFTVVNNGHTIQVNLPKGNALMVDGKRYELLQFHFHTPSEYTRKGKHAPMEVHLVHKSDDGKLAVLGVMIEEGSHNSALRSVWRNMPEQKGEVAVDSRLNPEDLLPESRRYAAFKGSLTTPPCSEGVAWHMLADPIEMSKSQIEQFKAIFPHNARPVQPLHGRSVRGAE